MKKKLIQFTDDLKVLLSDINEETRSYYNNFNDESEEEIRPLHVRLIATHSARITGNNKIYVPSKMKDATKTWTKHYKRPVLVNHDTYGDPIGRVESAEYVDTSSNYKDFLLQKDCKQTDDLLDQYIAGEMNWKDSVDYTVKHFVEELPIISDVDFPGLGYIVLDIIVSDKEAIKKIIDGRYLTGSISATTDSAICSICKQDWASDAGPCSHMPGKIYKNKKAVLIAGDMRFNEYSFVNNPADSLSSVITYWKDGIEQQININNMEDSMPVDQEDNLNFLKEFWKDKLDEIIGDDLWGNNYAEMMALEELRDKVLSAKARKALPESVFCGPERSFPCPDCHHIGVARTYLERYKGSGDKSKILACIERKAKRMKCGEYAKKNKDSDLGMYTVEFFDQYDDTSLKQMFDGIKNALEERGIVCTDCQEVNQQIKTLESSIETTKKELTDAQTELQTAYTNIEELTKKENELNTLLLAAKKEHLFVLKTFKDSTLTREVFEKDMEGKDLIAVVDELKSLETVDLQQENSILNNGPQPIDNLEQVQDPTLSNDQEKTENVIIDNDKIYEGIIKDYKRLKKTNHEYAERYLGKMLKRVNELKK